jgi:hypothetical protein
MTRCHLSEGRSEAVPFQGFSKTRAYLRICARCLSTSNVVCGDFLYCGPECRSAFFGHHRMHLCLEPGPQRDQLGPIAHQLPQLTRGRWRDPRLRQSTQPQHVDEIDRVAFVVLHATRAPVQPRRVREMDRRALLLQPVDDPIPATGGLDHHFGLRTRLRHRRRDRQRFIRDAHRTQLLARAVLADDHRTSTMKVDPDILSIHRGLPSSEEDWL